MSEAFRQTMAEVAEAEEVSKELVLPTGELVSLDSPEQCAAALASLRDIEQFVKEAKAAIVGALSEEAQRRGQNSFALADGTQVVVRRNYDIQWDAQQLEADLRAAGMPEERIREIVVEEVSWSVKAVEANKAAKANPESAEAVAAARSEVEKRPTISLPRG